MEGRHVEVEEVGHGVCHAGIVDQDGDVADLLLDRGADGEEGGSVGEVGLVVGEIGKGLKLGGKWRAVDDDKFGGWSEFRELEDLGEAEARAAASDEDDLGGAGCGGEGPGVARACEVEVVKGESVEDGIETRGEAKAEKPFESGKSGWKAFFDGVKEGLADLNGALEKDQEEWAGDEGFEGGGLEKVDQGGDSGWCHGELSGTPMLQIIYLMRATL